MVSPNFWMEVYMTKKGHSKVGGNHDEFLFRILLSTESLKHELPHLDWF